MPDTPAPASIGEPVDRDVDAPITRQGRGLRRSRWVMLAAVSAGGAIGALARDALTVLWPYQPGAFPWATFVINVTGCLLIGALMVLITEVWAAHQLLRLFLGTGVLGGYTTFSTYTVDVQQLVAAGAARTALLYLAATLTIALAAVYAGMTLTRLVIATHKPHKGRR